MTQQPSTEPQADATRSDLPLHASWGWTRAQRIGLGMLLGALVIVLVIGYVRRPMALNAPLVTLRGTVETPPQRMDPNTATASELARIPHVGDVLAQRIVAYRDQRRGITPDGIVYHHFSDLDAVPGVGKRLIEQMELYLQFPEDAAVPAQ